MADTLKASPRNAFMGALADAARTVNAFVSNPMGYRNPPGEMLMNALAVPSIATTLDRMSYGSPLTNTGKANVPFLKPETADALMMAPLSPRTALGLASAGLGVADAGAMRAATVWHGSPHKFDKFDASKIGTGEGAQAYGHGLYLADSPTVAKSYQAKVSAMHKSGAPTIDGSPINWDDPAQYAAFELSRHNGDRLAAADFAEQNFKGSQAPALLRSGAELPSVDLPGHLYKVDLPDQQIAKMLDWDKPLSQQAPEVRGSLERLGLTGAPTGADAYKLAADFDSRANVAKVTLSGGRDPARALRMAFPKITDSDIAAAIAKAKSPSGDAIASGMLRDAGITGIRYLDGGSRTAGQGSSNFVVFPGNETLLKILERNGKPLP